MIFFTLEQSYFQRKLSSCDGIIFSFWGKKLVDDFFMFQAVGAFVLMIPKFHSHIARWFESTTKPWNFWCVIPISATWDLAHHPNYQTSKGQRYRLCQPWLGTLCTMLMCCQEPTIVFFVGLDLYCLVQPMRMHIDYNTYIYIYLHILYIYTYLYTYIYIYISIYICFCFTFIHTLHTCMYIYIYCTFVCLSPIYIHSYIYIYIYSCFHIDDFIYRYSFIFMTI